jgi:hypothetical protein
MFNTTASEEGEVLIMNSIIITGSAPPAIFQTSKQQGNINFAHIVLVQVIIRLLAITLGPGGDKLGELGL